MALIHPLFRLCQPPTLDTAISVHGRRERALPFLAPSFPVASERERRVFTTVRPTPIFARTYHTNPGTVTITACAIATRPESTQNATIIPLLKQRRVEERRKEEEKEEARRTACEDIQTADANLFADPVPIDKPIVHTARDLSTLSSGTQNPWSSLQRRNRRFRPHKPREHLYRSVHSFTYPANSHICKTPHLRPPAVITPVIETIRHPYGIGPTKPVVRVPVTAPSLAPTQPALPTEVLITKTDHSIDTIHCHCGRLITVSKVSQLPTILHPTFRFISDFILYPIFFPSQLFSCFGFS